MTEVRDELADVLAYCLSLANALDIDIASAVESKMQRNALRYPAPVTSGPSQASGQDSR